MSLLSGGLPVLKTSNVPQSSPPCPASAEREFRGHALIDTVAEDWAGGERERESERERGVRETTGYEPCSSRAGRSSVDTGAPELAAVSSFCRERPLY